MRIQKATCLLLCCVTAVTTDLPAAADDTSRSSWECLPNGTVAAIRFPNGKAFFEALKETTKLGAVAFDDDRVDGLRELLISQPWWELVQKQLDQYAVSLDDLPRVLDGELGFAVVSPVAELEEIEESEMVPVGLAWSAPGEEFSQQLWEVIQQIVEEQQDGDLPMIRRDIDVAGQRAMLLVIPSQEDDFGDESLDVEDSIDSQVVSYTQLVLTRQQGRLLAAFTLEPVEDREDERTTDQLTEVLERFVVEHSDARGAFVSRVESVPGVQEALPQRGVPLFEMFVDVRLLIEIAIHEDLDEEEEDLERRRRILVASGADQIGIAATRFSLADSALHGGLFLEAPSPRSGLVKLIDQPDLEPRPPRWVPASAVEYQHLSLDLGVLYDEIRSFVTECIDEDAEQRFEMIDTYAGNFAGTSLRNVLSSLGRQHAVMQFEPRLKDLDDEDRVEPVAVQDRGAVVWAIEDQDIWNRLLTASRSITASMGEFVEYREEQGFSGYRSLNPMFEGGVFLGKGYLVLAVGEGMVEQTLSVLNHPPEGQDALVNSDVYLRAARLLPLVPGLSFQLSDGNRYAGFLHEAMDTLLNVSLWEYGESDDGDDDIRQTVEQLRDLLPDREEFEGLLGISVTCIRATDDGLELKQVSELPAP